MALMARPKSGALRIRNRLVGLAIVGSVSLGLTACSDSEKSDSSAPAAASHSPSASETPDKSVDPDAAQRVAVLETYSRMWAEQMKAYRKADAKGTDLTKYASLDALGKFRLDLAHMKENGTVIKGEMGHEDTKVSSLDLSAKTPKATVTDCIDLSQWQTYDVKAKKVIPLPSAQPMRYVATAKAEQWDGRWIVVDYVPNGERSC